MGSGIRANCRIGDFDYNIDKWIHDSSRKYGDTTIITTQSGVYFIFFVKSNTDDLDWKHAVRYTIAQQRFNDTTEDLINKEYKVTAKNEVCASKAYAHSNTVMQEFIANRLGAK